MQATRLVTFEGGALPSTSTASGAPSPLSAAPQLSLNPQDTSAPKAKSVRRWPALSLLAIAFVAFGGVIAVRAPGLLPQPVVPYAIMLAQEVERVVPGAAFAPPPPAASPDSEPGAPVPAEPGTPPAADMGEPSVQPSAAAIEPTSPAEPAPAASPQGVATAAPGAQAAELQAQPSAAQASATADTQAPGAAEPAPVVAEAPSALAASAVVAAPPAALTGGTAELEKQAIDLLLANDYPAARAVYERLRAVEPTRVEYGVMLDLLTREIAPACGGPGQEPCQSP